MIPSNPIPWTIPSVWKQVNACFRHHLKVHEKALDPARRCAGSIKMIFARLDPVLDDLCATTCPGCTDICCRRATIWFDFQDLLYLHLAGLPVAAAQTMTTVGQGCRYLAAGGCLLPRRQRPFVCTWYLCPPQKDCLANTKRYEDLKVFLDRLKEARQAMEVSFLECVRP